METPTPEKPKRVIFTVGGDKVDFTDLLPLTVGDKKQMKKNSDYGLDFNRLRDFDAFEEAKLALFICRKMRPATTMEEIDALPTLVSQGIIGHCVTVTLTPPDAGFSTPSTSSPAATAGGPTK